MSLVSLSVASVSPVHFSNCCWFPKTVSNWLDGDSDYSEGRLMIRGRRSCNWSQSQAQCLQTNCNLRRHQGSNNSDNRKKTGETLVSISKGALPSNYLFVEQGFFRIEMFLIGVLLASINAKYWHLRGGFYSENVTVVLDVIWRHSACENVWHFITCFVPSVPK